VFGDLLCICSVVIEVAGWHLMLKIEYHNEKWLSNLQMGQCDIRVWTKVFISIQLKDGYGKGSFILTMYQIYHT
jgi:hypothetical protein